MPRCLSNKILALAIGLGWWGLAGCKKKEEPVVHSVPVEVAKPNLAPLGSPPDWRALDGWQETMSRGDFERLLTTAFALPGAWRTTLDIQDNKVSIRRETANSQGGAYDLRFGSKQPSALLRYWRGKNELPASSTPDKPMEGLRIAIDPGHIGGNWAVMEERNFAPGNGPPVREGELTLIAAKLLQPMLEELGAKVTLVRSKTEPVTMQRPADFISQAKDELRSMGIDPANPPDTSPMHTVKWQSEKLFYRTAEIRARARLVNETVKPDFVICLHFNAAGGWGPPGQPKFSTQNHLHFLLNGSFGFDELVLDDQRHEMLVKLLSGIHDEEKGLALAVAQTLAASSNLPPFTYTAGALPVPGSPYLWTRNLLANRLYQCPVVYCEPYIMNNQEVAARLQAGDYEGEREIGGKPFQSIFREYAGGVAAGLRDYFSSRK